MQAPLRAWTELSRTATVVASVTKCVHSLLGDTSALKCSEVPDQVADRVSRDAINVLDMLSVSTAHPALLIIREAALGQKREHGDGMTSLVVLIGILTARAVSLMLQDGVPLARVVHGLRDAARVYQQVVQSMTAPLRLAVTVNPQPPAMKTPPQRAHSPGAGGGGGGGGLPAAALKSKPPLPGISRGGVKNQIVPENGSGTVPSISMPLSLSLCLP